MPNIDVTQLTQIVSLVLIILFAVAIVAVVYSTFRGFFRGWRYGTYRMVMSLIFIFVALFTVRPLVEYLGGMDVSSFGLPSVEFTVNGILVSSSWTTPLDTLEDLLSQTFYALNVNASPEEVMNLVVPLAYSLIALVILFVEALLLLTVWMFLTWFLWHLLFKRFIKKKKTFTAEKWEKKKRYYKKKKYVFRKEDGSVMVLHRKTTYRKGRWISLLEGAVTGVLSVALFLFPLTSILNSVSAGWNDLTSDEEKELGLVDNSTYQAIDTVLEAYDNSLFAQTFFHWNADENGVTLDTKVMDYFTSSQGEEDAISFLKELPNFVEIFSYLVEGGLFDSETGALNYAAALTSSFAPAILRSFGDSGLITGLMPAALSIATNIDTLSTYLQTDQGIDFHVFDYEVTFDSAADIYGAVLESGLLEDVDFSSSDSGKIVVDKIINGTGKDAFDAVFSSLSSDKLALVNDLLATVCYVVSAQEWEERTSGQVEGVPLGLMDFMPGFTNPDENGNGIPDKVPEEFFAINWGEELSIVYSNLMELTALNPSLFLEMLFPVEGETIAYEDEILSLFADHSHDVTRIFAGNDEESAKDSLLGSELICRGMPRVLESIQYSLNESASGDEALVDLTSVITYLKPQEGESTLSPSMTRIQNEFRALLQVGEEITSTEEGKNFLKNYEEVPGVYFDPNGNFLGIEEGLLTAFTGALRKLDTSRTAEVVLPALFERSLSGEDSITAQLGLEAGLDFNAPNLGNELANLLEAYNETQGLVTLALTIQGTNLSSPAELDRIIMQIAEHGDELGQLLKTFASSALLNPVMEGEDGTTIYNANIAGLLSTMLTPIFGEESVKNATELIKEENFDLNAEFDSLVGVINELASQHVLSILMQGSDLKEYGQISFELLFGAIGESQVMREILPSFLNDNLISGTFLEGSASFDHITDWAAEGACLDIVMGGAEVLGSLGSLNYFGSDANAVANLLYGLSQSSLFVTPEGEYGFSTFIANQFIDSVIASDNGQAFSRLFADPITDPNAELTFERLRTNMTAITKEGWVKECEVLRSLIYDMQRAHDMSFFERNVDLMLVDLRFVELTVEDMLSSEVFGPILGPNFYTQFINAMVDAGFEEFQNADLNYLWTTDIAGIETELRTLLDMLYCLLDPVYGFLDDSGQLSNILTAEYFQAHSDLVPGIVRYTANPVLTYMEESAVLNSQDPAALHPTPYKAFKQYLEDAIASLIPNIPGGGDESLGDIIENLPDDVQGMLDDLFPDLNLPF